MVYTGKNGTFTLYEDENINYNYENGAFSTIPFTYNENARMLIIGERSGSFPGMLEERTFEIMWVTKDDPSGLDLNRAPDETVRYTGQEIIVER